ncbi:helix-turn-helix domain-containing protein [Pseudomonas sp. EA_5y_Pfl2_R50]|uniref:helix-turn-helix domain-containing protein n=1 Tax=Pseudomonas sp. EA_5y_Pfl2_R50 TaxID=3088691 RepID=UPI0030DC52A5
MQMKQRCSVLVVFWFGWRSILHFSYRFFRSTTYAPLPEDVFCFFSPDGFQKKEKSVAIQFYFQTAIVMSISSEDRDFLVAMGSRIAHLRTVHEITQTRFARALGLSRQTFQGYEEGARSMPVTTLVKMAFALRVPVEDLLGVPSYTETPRRSLTSTWYRRLQSINELSKVQQKVIAQMLDALIAQAATKSSDEEREI